MGLMFDQCSNQTDSTDRISLSYQKQLLKPHTHTHTHNMKVVLKFVLQLFYCSGDSANAVPPTKKLRTRVTRIWGDRSGQPNRSAMERPRAGPTCLMIQVQPVPGKYA